MSIPNDKVPVVPDPVELGYVDASSGILHLEIPFGSYPQRGSNRPLVNKWTYDSSIWTVKSNPNPAWSPTGVVDPTGDFGGWRFLPFMDYKNPSPLGFTSNNGDPCDELYNFNWTDPSGTVHFFPVIVYSPVTQGLSCGASTGDAFATDSSGYHMYVTAGATSGSPPLATVYAPDGTLVYISYAVNLGTFRNPGPYRGPMDSNGNYFASFVDTLGRNIGSLPNSQGTGSTHGSTGGGEINPHTQFGQSGIAECIQNPPSSYCILDLIAGITLPDGTSYQFKYDCDSSTGNAFCGSPAGQSAYYGTLISVTLPTGGTITYTYTNITDSQGGVHRAVSSRTAAGGTWKYTYATQSGDIHPQTTITKPNGDTIVYVFAVFNGIWPQTISYYQGSPSANNLLAQVSDVYDASQTCPLVNCSGPAYIRKLSETVTLTSAVGSITKQTLYAYDSPQTGNVTAIKEWGYRAGTSFPVTPDRATYISYLTTGTNNINRPLSTTICNNSGSDSACPGGGSRVSQTLYNYDSYGTNGPASVTAVNHNASFGSTYTARGNPTQVQRWVSGSTY